MATSTQNFAQTPYYLATVLGTANANRDGTTGAGYSKVCDPTVDYIIRDVQCIARVTTTAGAVRFYTSPDGGTTRNYLDELKVVAQTPDAAVNNPWPYPVSGNGQLAKLIGQAFPSTVTIWCSTEKNEAILVHVWAEKFS